MRKLDIRVMRTHDQLIAGLVKLLASKSFEDLSVSEICDTAKVHRATFYKHFNDKYEFLNFCFDHELSKINFGTSEESPSAENIKENFMSFIKTTFEFITSKQALFSVILSTKYSATLGASFTNAVYNYSIEKVKIILPDADEKRAELFAAFYSNAFIGVVTHYAKNIKDYPLEEVYDFLENRVDELCATYIKQMGNQ